MNAKIGLLMVLMFLALPVWSFSQTVSTVDEVVQKLQIFYDRTKDLKANFIQETTIKSMRRTEREEGAVFFKSPQKMLWAYTTPKGKRFVAAFKTAWLYLPDEKVVYRQKAESIFQSKFLMNFFTGKGKLKDDFIIKFATPYFLDQEGNYLLVLTPKENTLACGSITMKIDKNKFCILQISFEDATGNLTRLSFSNISVNTGLRDHLFQFNPPRGVRVFDM